MALKKHIRVSFIGAGAMTIEHLKVFSVHKNIKISGIYSRTRKKASQLAKLFKIPFVAQNIENLYTNTNSDLVIVSVNETSTEKVCYSCFKFPWKIIVEKPVGYNLKIAQRIFNKSQLTKSDLYVAMNRRHYSSTKNLIRLAAKENGKKILTIIDAQDISLAKKYNTPNIILKNYMYANSVHLIDYFNFAIKSEIKHIKKIVNNKNFISAIITYKNGDIGQYYCFWNRPGPWSVNLSTKKMYITLSPVEKIQYRNNKSYKNNEITTPKEDLIYKAGFYTQSKEIIKLVMNKKSKLTSMKDFIKTMKIINGIYK